MLGFRVLISALLLVALIAQSHCVTSSQLNSSSSKSTTTLRPIVERVFSRKRRFLLFPKGGALKATIQLTKRLVAVVPRGMMFSVELATYYPCPDKRIDLIPKRLRKPTTPKPMGPPKPPVYVYIPGTEIRYKAKPAAKPEKVQRIDEFGGGGGALVQWLEPKPTLSYANPQKWKQWSKYGTAAYQHKYDWTPAPHVAQWQPGGAQQSKWAHWRQTPTITPAASASKWTKWTQHAHQRWTRDSEGNSPESAAHTYEDPETIAYRPMYFEDLEQFDDSRHYHSHRDRRQLFAQFEPLSRILGIDMKACVLRAVCESKRLLLPPGYSLLQDVMRLILTFPTINGLNDEYSRLMRTDYHTCHRRLRNKCSISVLAWLLQPQKVTML